MSNRAVLFTSQLLGGIIQNPSSLHKENTTALAFVFFASVNFGQYLFYKSIDPNAYKQYA
jgi:hypothetical protein